MSGRRILITGGAGFIGVHLARRVLEEQTDSVTLVDNFSRGRQDPELDELSAAPNVELVTADLTDRAAWDELGSGFDEVYHLAAMLGVKHVLTRPQEVIRVNTLTVLHMLDWLVSGGGDRVLFSSTSEAYAWTQHFYELPIPTPEDVPVSLTDLANPRSSYAGTKVFGELAVAQYCRAHERPYAIVRYHNVYGPRMGMDHVIPEVFMRARSGQDPLVVYSPDHIRAFCYVSDAVEATVMAVRSERGAGQTFNVGNDREEVRIEELARELLEVARIDVEIDPQPANDPISRRCPDVTRARDLLGYEPEVSLRRGLELTLAWYETNLDSAPAEGPSAQAARAGAAASRPR